MSRGTPPARDTGRAVGNRERTADGERPIHVFGSLTMVEPGYTPVQKGDHVEGPDVWWHLLAPSRVATLRDGGQAPVALCTSAAVVVARVEGENLNETSCFFARRPSPRIPRLARRESSVPTTGHHMWERHSEWTRQEETDGRALHDPWAGADPFAETLTAHRGCAGRWATTSVETASPRSGGHPRYCVDGGRTLVAMTPKELAHRIVCGTVPRSARVWREGLECWTQADTVADLAPAVARTPRPTTGLRGNGGSRFGAAGTEAPHDAPGRVSAKGLDARRAIPLRVNSRPWSHKNHWLALAAALVCTLVAVRIDGLAGPPVVTPQSNDHSGLDDNGTGRGRRAELRELPRSSTHGDRGQRRVPRTGRGSRTSSRDRTSTD